MLPMNNFAPAKLWAFGALFAAILLDGGSALAQTKERTPSIPRHTHYKLVDMGTFGGPVSSINYPVYGHNLNSRGLTVGWSATRARTSTTSSPFVCGGLDGVVPFITHAFQWIGAVMDLGALSPQRKNCSEPFAVNAKGEIVGASENGEFDPLLGINQARAVLWEDGEIVDLGSLGGYESAAFAINDHGQIVGNSTNTIPDPFCFLNSAQNRAFLWQRGHMQDLETLGGNCSGATAINDRGRVVGNSTTSSIPTITGVPSWDPFIWEEGKGMIDLGTLGGFFGTAFDLNNRDQVIGESSIAKDPEACSVPDSGNTNCHPFLWERGRMIDLSKSTVGGKPLGLSGIDDDGDIIGNAVFPKAPFDAMLWVGGFATDLGHLDGCTSSAHAINSRRQIVGWVFPCGNGDIRAFLWEHGSMVDLNTLIPPDSSLKLVQAEDINDRGEIDGIGVRHGVSTRDFTTRGHGFLLIPCDENHLNVQGCDYSLVTR